jgi:diketogulonate reductase-like aldo/keto reductase
MTMRMVRARGGCTMPALGLGTWKMGDDPARRKDEVAALRLGLDLGMTLIDTAEIYASGGAEEVTGEAVAGRRDAVFIVSKVHQTNASRDGTVRAAEASLKRMRTEWIDLYLLHNRGGPYPHEETLEALHRLKQAGKIRHFGLSNFDRPDMERSEAMPHGPEVAANQLRYSLARRSLDNGLGTWHAKHDIAVMAYTPLEEGFLKPRPGLAEVARRHGVSPMCIALAWTLRDPNVVTIPKASNPAHVRENVRAVDIRLSAEDIEALDRDYPRPPPGTFDIWTA